jgi:hypothetical protein
MKTTLKAVLGVALMGGMVAVAGGIAWASEEEVLKKCELSLCELIVKKDAAGGNIACDLVKTWGAEDIKKGAEAGKLEWSWGDAQCKTKVDLDRAALLSALTQDKFELKLPATPVNCVIGGGEPSEVNFTLAPVVTFDKGVAQSATIGIDNIDGSLMKRMALKTAQLIDKSKLLDGILAKEINKFIGENCPKKVQ